MNQPSKVTQVPNGMLLRLQAIYNSLKRAERAAADLLIEKPNLVATSNTATLSKIIDASQPTFVRLAQRMGYSGFSELKKALIEGESLENAEKVRKVGLPYERISDNDSAGRIAQSVVRASINALNNMMCVMDENEYDRAADALIQAERIAFFGSGDSGIVARSAFQKFLRVGAVCHTAEDYDTQLMISSLLNEKCVCLLVSHSGDTATIVQIAKIAKSAGAITIAVTNFPYSHLAKICDIVLQTATFVEYNGEVATQRIAQLVIIESLYIAYRVRLRAECEKALSATDHVIGTIQKS